MEDINPILLFVHLEFHDTVNPYIKKIKSLRSLYSIGEAQSKFRAFNDLMVGETFPKVDIGSETPLMIIHTAATTGRSRGAILTHGNFIASNTFLSLVESLSFNSKDVYLVFLSLSHVFGLTAVMAIFQAGGLNLIMPRFEPENIKKLHHMTHAEFWSTYGQTETMGGITFSPFSDRLGSAGRPGPLTNIKLVDHYDNPVPEGKSGEIAVRGPLVFKGYWGLAEDTQYTFRGGWHHTGDLGQFDEEGYLWYRGRKAEKELIKPGGENVYPAEVEKAILAHPSVVETCVIGVPHPKWGEGIKAICVLKPGATLGEEELIEFVASQIARYKKPHFVVFVDSFPKTASGEVDREKVKARYGKTS